MSSQGINLGIAAALAVAVVGTGVWVLTTKHESRQLFAELEALKREQDRLQIDWGRLQLEQSTRATHPRIEVLARDRLDLQEIAAGQTVFVAEPGQ